MNDKVELKPWQPNINVFKRLVGEAMTQYDADQYLAGKSIDPIKQCEFVGASLGLEFQKHLMEYLWGDCTTHEPPIQFINYRPKIYRWGCRECQNELKKYFGVK
jgi:hypothetical protein